MLSLLVDTRFQVLLTPLTGVLFTFPSRYLFTIGRQVVFRLTGWSRQIQAGLLVSRLTWGFRSAPNQFRLRGFHPLWHAFPSVSAIGQKSFRGPATPTQFLAAVWPLPLSLATTSGITLVFFSSGY